METYIVYEIQGYKEYFPEKNMYTDVIKVQVVAETEDEALEKAKKHHPSRPFFRCVGSVEYVRKNESA